MPCYIHQQLSLLTFLVTEWRRRVYAGHDDIVNFLLRRFHRLRVDQSNKLGFTALMKAAIQGRTRCAKLLLFAGLLLVYCISRLRHVHNNLLFTTVIGLVIVKSVVRLRLPSNVVLPISKAFISDCCLSVWCAFVVMTTTPRLRAWRQQQLERCRFSVLWSDISLFLLSATTSSDYAITRIYWLAYLLAGASWDDLHYWIAPSFIVYSKHFSDVFQVKGDPPIGWGVRHPIFGTNGATIFDIAESLLWVMYTNNVQHIVTAKLRLCQPHSAIGFHWGLIYLVSVEDTYIPVSPQVGPSWR